MGVAMQITRNGHFTDTHAPVDVDEAVAIVRAFILGRPVPVPDSHKKADDVTAVRFFEDR